MRIVKKYGFTSSSLKFTENGRVKGRNFCLCKSKREKSLIDDEIGQDFLSSWKSMSVTQDDAMDFNFDPVPSGKKKKLNFEELDMDFNLDADFNKLSSFKVDMPDLDFLSPSEKTAKPKERTEDSSSSRGNSQGKKDRFSFSFDFNDEDFANDAQFGSKLMGSSKSVTREIANDEPVLLRSKENIKDLINIREDFNFDGVQNTSKVIGNLRPLDEQGIQGEPTLLRSEKNAGEDLLENHEQIGSQPGGNSKSPARELTESEPDFMISENNVKNVNDIREGSNSDGVQNGSQLVGELRSLDKQVIQGEPDMLRSEKNSGREDLHANDVQIGSQSMGNSKSVIRDLTEGEPVLLRSENNVKNLSNIREAFESDGEQNGSKLVGDVRLQDNQAAKGESVMPESENNTGEGFNTNDTQVGNKLVVLKLPSRELTKTEAVLEEREKNDKNLCNIRKGFNVDVVRNGSKVVGNSRSSQEKEATSGKLVQLRSEKNSVEGFNTNDAQVGNKLVVLKLPTRELTKTEAVLEEREKNDKNLSNIRKGFNVDGVRNGSNVVGNSRSQEKEATSGKPVQLRSEKNSVFQVNPSSSTEKIAKSNAQASGNSKFVISSMESTQNMKNNSVEGIKIGKRTPELFSLKNLRTVGANRDLPNPTVPRQNNSLRNSEQNTKLAGNTTSKIAHPVSGTEKQKPLTPTLKRKISEESNADLVSLKPPKRLSESPKESRSIKEYSGGAVEEETSNNENQAQSKTKNVFHDQPTSRAEVSQEINMTELEIPLAMENDGNVEKAEAYTKELEDICNMLKKKHEEAKELLVRALVNNNNLLMLNHPIYEEKIRMVQNFAMQLTLKEIPIDP
ncbi:hypothetical protein LWI29_016524 [Acer saccharum]|uniref:Uncharacterized protein n=1 Tax=Acer saccharum TaxID=4024 RepID=A0AA39V7V4_ACESA|nr:hypothetical protein LWI29_016524 [Acer saccharum]